MTILSTLAASVLIYAGLFSGIVLANGFDLAKFQEVYANGSKEKDAEIVYILPDASVAKKGDPGAGPAVRLALSNEPEHLVMQDVSLTHPSKNIDVSLEVWASTDLQHEKGDANWSDAGTYYCEMPFHPNVDFWFLRCPGFGYYLTNLDHGKWNKLRAHFLSPRAGAFDHFEFHVPVGSGFILLRNFSVASAS